MGIIKILQLRNKVRNELEVAGNAFFLIFTWQMLAKLLRPVTYPIRSTSLLKERCCCLPNIGANPERGRIMAAGTVVSAVQDSIKKTLLFAER